MPDRGCIQLLDTLGLGPFDFQVSPNARLRVHEAGLVTQPHGRLYGDCNLMVDDRGVHLACLSETIVLSMESARRNYSVGRTLDLDDMEELKSMAVRNNFPPLGTGHALTELALANGDEDSIEATLSAGF